MRVTLAINDLLQVNDDFRNESKSRAEYVSVLNDICKTKTKVITLKSRSPYLPIRPRSIIDNHSSILRCWLHDQTLFSNDTKVLEEDE